MYNLKIIKSGRRLEIYRINNYVIRSNEHDDIFKDNNGRAGDEGLDEDIKDYNKDRARATTLTNARNNIIRLIKCNEDMKTLITLTFKKESNYIDSKQLLKQYFKKLRKDNIGLKYIWILEFGGLNGRLHYHVLCNIPITIKLSKSDERKSQDHKDLENKFRLRYWKHGWTDIRHLGQEDNTNIALYVAAYITKDLIDKQFEGYRVYGYSHKTLNKPEIATEYTTESLDSLLVRYSKEYDIKYTSSYGIGYKDYKGVHTGVVSYFDLVQKED